MNERTLIRTFRKIFLEVLAKPATSPPRKSACPGRRWMPSPCNCLPPAGDNMAGEVQNANPPFLLKPRASPRGFFLPYLGDHPHPWHSAIMPTPFDPLHWLATKDTEAFLDPAGQVRLRFGQFVRQEEKQRIRRVIAHYADLLRLQLNGVLACGSEYLCRFITILFIVSRETYAIDCC